MSYKLVVDSCTDLPEELKKDPRIEVIPLILQIGDYLGLPYEWVHKTPDDGLPNSSPDEEKFGFTYKLLDSYIRNGFRSFDDADKESIHKIRKMIISSEFKRNPMSTFKNLQI